jgi:hypothetical protein
LPTGKRNYGVLGTRRYSIAGLKNVCTPMTVVNDAIGRAQPSLKQRVVYLWLLSMRSEIVRSDNNLDVCGTQFIYQRNRLRVVQLHLIYEVKMEDFNLTGIPFVERSTFAWEILFD